MAVFNGTIANGAHDMAARGLNSTLDTTNTIVRIGWVGGNNYRSLYHFPSTGIPQGATITAATMTLNCTVNGGSPITICMENADNPSAPTTYAQFNAMALTSSPTSWSPSGTGSKTTPDISAHVQAVVNRAGFGGNMNFVFLNDGIGGSQTAFSSYNSGANYATVAITYTASASNAPYYAIKQSQPTRRFARN